MSCARHEFAFCRPLTGHSPESLVSREQLLWERQDALWQQEVQRSAPDWPWQHCTAVRA